MSQVRKGLEFKVCKSCGKKEVRPEKYGKVWRYPSAGICFNCIMVQEGLLSDISKRKASRGKAVKYPLAIVDLHDSKLVGHYSTKLDVQAAIDRYQREKTVPAKLAVISYPGYVEYTQFFRNTGNE